MNLNTNYYKALGERYSKYSLDEFVKKAENSHLYILHKHYFIATTYYEEPKLTIIEDEYEENFFGCKYEGEVKEEFEIIKYCFHFDEEIDKSPQGEKIILDTFSLKNKFPDEDICDLFFRLYDNPDNESNFSSLEAKYMDVWKYSITEAERSDYLFGPELIIEGELYDLVQYEDYPYLTEPGPFKILKYKTGDYEDVYLEYGDPWSRTSVDFKTKGLNHLQTGFQEIYENIKEYGKK